MFLKKLILILVFGFVISGDVFSQTNEVFKFTDGYFLTGRGPVHLIHDDAQPEISLGDEYSLRLSFKVNEGAVNPCSRREENPCYVIQQVVVKRDNDEEEFVAGWKKGLDFRADDLFGFGIPLTMIPRTATTGDVTLVVKMLKEDKEVYRKEWPMKIW